MNIKEVYTLSHNLGEFYRGVPYPYLYFQIGKHRWYLSEGKIMERLKPYIPQESSKYLFNWVEA